MQLTALRKQILDFQIAQYRNQMSPLQISELALQIRANCAAYVHQMQPQLSLDYCYESSVLLQDGEFKINSKLYQALESFKRQAESPAMDTANVLLLARKRQVSNDLDAAQRDLYAVADAILAAQRESEAATESAGQVEQNEALLIQDIQELERQLSEKKAEIERRAAELQALKEKNREFTDALADRQKARSDYISYLRLQNAAAGEIVSLFDGMLLTYREIVSTQHQQLLERFRSAASAEFALPQRQDSLEDAAKADVSALDDGTAKPFKDWRFGNVAAPGGKRTSAAERHESKTSDPGADRQQASVFPFSQQIANIRERFGTDGVAAYNQRGLAANTDNYSQDDAFAELYEFLDGPEEKALEALQNKGPNTVKKAFSQTGAVGKQKRRVPSIPGVTGAAKQPPVNQIGDVIVKMQGAGSKNELMYQPHRAAAGTDDLNGPAEQEKTKKDRAATEAAARKATVIPGVQGVQAAQTENKAPTQLNIEPADQADKDSLPEYPEADFPLDQLPSARKMAEYLLRQAGQERPFAQRESDGQEGKKADSEALEAARIRAEQRARTYEARQQMLKSEEIGTRERLLKERDERLLQFYKTRHERPAADKKVSFIEQPEFIDAFSGKKAAVVAKEPKKREQRQTEIPYSMSAKQQEKTTTFDILRQIEADVFG